MEELRIREAEMARQARLFDTALSSMADFAYVCDLEGRIAYANRALLELWQKPLAGVVGKTFAELDYPRELADRLQAQIQTVVETKQPLRDETAYTGAAGITGYYEYIFAPVIGVDGQVEAVAGSTRDITVRHHEKAEKEALLKTLEVERARLKTLFMQAPAFISVTRGPKHIFDMVNPPYLQLVGQRDLIGKTVREAFPEIEGQGFFELLDEVYRSGKPYVGKDMRILFQESADAPMRERFLDFVYQPLIEADGSVSGIFAHGVDLTERKQAEQALQESELKFRSLFENAREAIGIATRGRVVFVNPAYARLLGYDTPEEMIGLSSVETVAPADRARLNAMAHRRNAGEDVPFGYEYRGLKKDGTERDLENYVSSYEQNGQMYTVVTTRDITERKQAEIARQFLADASALLASSLDYEQTLQQVADLAVPRIADWCGVDIREADGSISQLAVAHVNPEKVKWGHELRRRYPPDPNAPRGLANVLCTGQAEIYSHVPDELLVAGAKDAEHLEMMRQIGLDSLMMVPIIARDRILGAITFVATNESGHHYTEADLELARGLATRAALAIDNARLYRAAQQELAERRRVQAALLASEERFRFALANSSIIVYTQDRDLRYTWIYNGAISGEDSHAYGKTDAEIMAEEDAVPLMEIKERVLQTGIEERHVIRATTPTQGTLYFDIIIAPLRDANQNIIGITGTANDITERKTAQDALAQHQAEIEALNVRLQRSMRETHHRVKNNLQVITALVNMQQMQYEDQVPTAELQRLTQHIRALASIHDLLTHQAQTDAEVSDISVQDVMEKLMPTVQGMVAGRQITFDVEDIRLPVRQSTTFAVLVNELVSNALKHGAGEIHVGFCVEGSSAFLQVEDEGPGFPPNFNPAQAANTGLDLISSLSRMDMRGSVRYENREAGGARVVVEFPVPSLVKTPGEQ